MRRHIALLALVAVVAVITTAEARKKLRKLGSSRHPHKRIKPVPDSSAYFDNELNEISDALNEIDSMDDLQHNLDPPKVYDPCKKRHCSAGQVCKLTDDGEPVCICVEDCAQESDPRRKVCSNLNETWASDCEMSQMRCWCEMEDVRCKDERMAHQHIDYYSSCRQIEDCSKDQMLDFPRRMRDWLFHIMRDMADRDELSPYYQMMERKAETNHTRRWAVAAVWKWCDLDSGHDRSVSRHELFPIRAPLVAMEHCIAPFLNSCDENDDHKITLQEWTRCLELEEDDIEEHCEDVRDEDF